MQVAPPHKLLILHTVLKLITLLRAKGVVEWAMSLRC